VIHSPAFERFCAELFFMTGSMDDITALRAALAAAGRVPVLPKPGPQTLKPEQSALKRRLPILNILLHGCVRTASGRHRNGDGACWTSWNLSWRSWKQRKPKTRSKMRRTSLSVQQHRGITGAAALTRRPATRTDGSSCANTVSVLWRMRLSKLGESITETLEVIPRQFKVIQTVREKFTCRDCESITQPPAPFYPISRACRARTAGDHPVRQVSASAAEQQSDAFAAKGLISTRQR
jgi:hypothetical protein